MKGFTIVELLVAMAITLVVTAATLSPHRNRAIVCSILLALVLLGAVRVLVAAIGTPAA